MGFCRNRHCENRNFLTAMLILHKFDKSSVFHFTGGAYHNMRRTKYHKEKEKTI